MGKRSDASLPHETPLNSPTPAAAEQQAAYTVPHGVGALRKALEAAVAESGRSMRDLTVLERHSDPFRADTPAGHRDGAWLATTAARLGLGSRKIHLRGLHYMVLGQTKPDGTTYASTDENWAWLSEGASWAARWLGYIPFDQIEDHRNAPPVVREFSWPEPRAHIFVGLHVDIPDVEDMEPSAYPFDFRGVQPYKIVMFGEKSSLEPVLGPLAERHKADLYLMTGEISSTYIHQFAKAADDEGRPLVVLCFSDADPAGWQMPISIGRKLQAFKAGLFPDLEFQVRRAALTPEQALGLGLPSTPLKESEWRADKWRAVMGTDQTEVDALAALQPDLLRQLARDALAPFYDYSLNQRVEQARQEWAAEANEVLRDGLDQDALDQIRTEAGERLAELREQIDALNEQLHIDADDFELPEIIVPEAEISGGGGGPPALIDSRWTFARQTRALIDSKRYELESHARLADRGGAR